MFLVLINKVYTEYLLIATGYVSAIAMFKQRCRQVIDSDPELSQDTNEEEDSVETQDKVEEEATIEEEETIEGEEAIEEEETIVEEETQPAGSILFSTLNFPLEAKKTSIESGTQESELQTKEPTTDDVTLVNDDEDVKKPLYLREGEWK